MWGENVWLSLLSLDYAFIIIIGQFSDEFRQSDMVTCCIYMYTQSARKEEISRNFDFGSNFSDVFFAYSEGKIDLIGELRTKHPKRKEFFAICSLL